MRRPDSRACVAQSESEGSSEGSGISDSDSEGTIEFKKAEALTRRLERRKQRRALRGEGMTLTQEGVAKPTGFLDMAGPRGSQPLSQRGSQRASSQRGSQQPASQRGSQRSSQGGYSPSLSPVPGGSQAGRGSGQSLASGSASEQEERLPQQTDPGFGSGASRDDDAEEEEEAEEPFVPAYRRRQLERQKQRESGGGGGSAYYVPPSDSATQADADSTFASASPTQEPAAADAPRRQSSTGGWAASQARQYCFSRPCTPWFTKLRDTKVSKLRLR